VKKTAERLEEIGGWGALGMEELGGWRRLGRLEEVREANCY
jgi:hypothetical protein